MILIQPSLFLCKMDNAYPLSLEVHGLAKKPDRLLETQIEDVKNSHPSINVSNFLFQKKRFKKI